MLAFATAGVFGICTTIESLANTFVGGVADPTQFAHRLRPALLRNAAESSDASVTSVEAEVVTESRSRPMQLLHSPGVQQLVGVLRRLRDAPKNPEGMEDSALDVVLNNLVGSGEVFLNREIPEHLQDDADEIVEALSTLLDSVENDSSREAWQKPLQQLGQLRVAQRLPDIVEQLLPWDVVYPQTLADQTGVRREELATATKSFIKAVRLDELATWSEAELDEASELVEKDEILSKVATVIESIIDASMASMVGTFTGVWVTLLAVLVLFVVAIANCLGLFNGGPPGSEVPVPTDLPLYKLGGSTGGGAPAPTPTESNLGVVPLYRLGDIIKP